MNLAPLVRGLIHTDVLLDFREGWPLPLQFMGAVIQAHRPNMSELSAMQLIANCPTVADLVTLRRFFSGCDIHPVAARLSRRAFALLDSLPPPSPLTADDAMVAVTAIEHSLPLYTLDPARFAIVPGLTAIQPY